MSSDVGSNGTLIDFTVDGRDVSVPAEGTLLDALREHVGVSTVKDGCSPQGQCGCCTIWVDGQPRVSCVTPVARVRGRAITTVDGLPDAEAWGRAFAEHGGSQCGFCTPGIIMRAAALSAERQGSPEAIGQALLAHLCRCTGWQPIVESITSVNFGAVPVAPDPSDVAAAERRAMLEGGVPQTVGAMVALGRGGFADDTAPAGALVAVRSAEGDWVVGETLHAARVASGKVQGRRTTAPLDWPVPMPDGEFVRQLQTTWVEPAYLEPDASWCEPGGEPVSSHGNGGAFGGKMSGELGVVARRLADQHQRAVRVLSTREDVVRLGPKRPPLAAAVRSDGSGVVQVARTAGVTDLVAVDFPAFDVVEVDVAGPPTSLDLRGAVWAELTALTASLQPGPTYTVTGRTGATATAEVDESGAISVSIRCGRPLHESVLRSYCMGAVHMALGWVTSEGISVDAEGAPHDLTIRSFGVLRSVDTPPITVTIEPDDGEPVNGSDAVFAAVAAAVWSTTGFASRWPTAH